MMNICEIPEGLSEMLRDFTVAVLRHCPENLYEFAADYFAKVLDARTSNAIPMYIVVQDDDDAGEPDPVAFKPKTARQNRLGRRHSVSAERYDPEADEEEEEEAAEATGAGAGEEEAACKRTVVYAKNDSQRQRLKEAVAGILIFRSLEPDQVNDVIDAMFERRVVPEEHVIEQDDDGDNFYVIESGTYDVIVRVTDDGGGGGVAGEWRKVHQFEDKGSFGELALMYNMPRSATVVAVTPGTLWAMDRKSFRRIVLRSAYRKRKRYEALLDAVPMLRSIDANERMNLADALTSAVFQDGERIIRQGAVADGMYFVEEGEVRIVIATTARDGAAAAGQREKEVTRLKTGNYFGEMALVENSPRSASVFAVGTTKVAFLERSSFERLLGPCIDVMKRNIDVYRKMNP